MCLPVRRGAVHPGTDVRPGGGRPSRARPESALRPIVTARLQARQYPANTESTAGGNRVEDCRNQRPNRGKKMLSRAKSLVGRPRRSIVATGSGPPTRPTRRRPVPVAVCAMQRPRPPAAPIRRSARRGPTRDPAALDVTEVPCPEPRSRRRSAATILDSPRGPALGGRGGHLRTDDMRKSGQRCLSVYGINHCPAPFNAYQ